MAVDGKNKVAIEFGDYQTPRVLAQASCRRVSLLHLKPTSVLEPTCGVGTFLAAALDEFPQIRKAIGFDINPTYVDEARKRLEGKSYAADVRIGQGDFFHTDWGAVLKEIPDPLLIVGNPPWVTNAALGALGGANLPEKSNFQNHGGLDAVTGKGNFDISEWMLMRLFELLNGRQAALAMLCKTAVARKVLLHAWKNRIQLADARLYPIEAQRYFGAAVEACLLISTFVPLTGNQDCFVYRTFDADYPHQIIGYRDEQLVADIGLYEKWKHLRGASGYHRWRSGVKHDCVRVMEFVKESDYFRNGLNDLVELEDEYLYPMLKSSQVAGQGGTYALRWMLVTQKNVGDPTDIIQKTAPRTWCYLQQHAELLDKRASVIYKKRPRFSVFGVGDYSFSPWKVVISGFYKRLQFKAIGPVSSKPVVLDDTAYFLPCQTGPEAEHLAALLNSNIAREFFSAFIFWDAKRPITVDLLSQLNLERLACELGSEEILKCYPMKAATVSSPPLGSGPVQT
jgi:SAM-dependent methyltransferase